jgi:MFS family permease
MNKKQLAILCTCSTVSWSIGNGVLPLLPIYATQLGATPLIAGFYLSFCYLAIASGAILAGWLSNRLQRYKMPLIAIDIAALVPIYWMGRVSSVGSLALLTAILWLLGGVKLALVSILGGLLADEAERGKVFGILALTTSLGMLVGGLSAGPIVDRWGYSTLFSVAAVFCLISPLAALWLEDKPAVQAQRGGEPGPHAGDRLGKPFALLFLAALVSATGGFAGLMGRSLAMNGLGFAATAISITSVIGGIVSLPMSPVAGWLSDRVDRGRLLVAGYMLGVLSLLALMVSSALWHFWGTVILSYTSMAITSAVGPALVADIVPSSAIGKALSRFSATGWIGGIVGFAGTGYAIQALGLQPTFALGAFLSLAATVLVVTVSRFASQQADLTA